MNIRCTQANHQNQQIMGFCINRICPDLRPYCNFCLPCHSKHLNMLTSLELLYGWIQQRILIIQDVEKSVQECKFSLDNLLNQFLPYLHLNIQQLQELGLSELDILIKSLCQMEDCEESLFIQLQQQIEQIQSIIKETLQIIKSFSYLKQNEILLSPLDITIQEQPKHECVLNPNQNQFTFELMQQNSIKQKEWCRVIAFNKDNLIVAVGCHKNIKIFSHIQGQLKPIQSLSEHANSVLTLSFMKNSNNLVSGSLDNLIIIWQINEYNQWDCKQKLNGQSGSVFCLLLSNDDDLIISSGDNSIKFWTKQKQWSCSQTITQHTKSVYSLNLNQTQNKLISCSADSLILVIVQRTLDKKWDVLQKIKADQYGYRLCFINDNIFTFQPYCKEFMHVYEMDCNSQQYRKTKEIIVNCGSKDDCQFQQQYIDSKGILVNKNGNNIILLRKLENDGFIVEQSIEFQKYNIFGQVSNDGEYLITWDEISKEIQIRQYKE
ncbi:unnamed protein product (macronuclear) [Paramecium tetraurelia]|uniref:Uncharacterized protein n=1 Tax=Paramecium tetraurelia TaxID=5888 RepID=A0C680_PARTE|nr:uncharacterized protein GSPATT00035426001 [Paramecium tetraurelia]CAK66297.1 unnamed protein product [Paramecium tetraurelia]|eukprot:XP_001433694.1 hypothetical protein (macronuclear) [Paramecium tetraurelia strain d4-2]